MIAATHTPQRDRPIRDIIARMRHNGCLRRPGRLELLIGIKAAVGRRGCLYLLGTSAERPVQPAREQPYSRPARNRRILPRGRRGSPTPRRRSAGHGDLPRTWRILLRT